MHSVYVMSFSQQTSLVIQMIWIHPNKKTILSKYFTAHQIILDLVYHLHHFLN